MLNIPTTEVISIQFDVLVFWILSALIIGIFIGYEIRGILLKYRIINIQKEKLSTAV